jgi:hypothetical protein
MNIEVLGFADCPNTSLFHERIEQAAREVAPGSRVRYVDQEHLPPSDLRRGYPAPTVLIDGRDLFGFPPPTAPTLGCRIYPGGIPTVAEFRERLRPHVARGSGASMGPHGRRSP